MKKLSFDRFNLIVIADSVNRYYLLSLIFEAAMTILYTMLISAIDPKSLAWKFLIAQLTESLNQMISARILTPEYYNKLLYNNVNVLYNKLYSMKRYERDLYLENKTKVDKFNSLIDKIISIELEILCWILPMSVSVISVIFVSENKLMTLTIVSVEVVIIAIVSKYVEDLLKTINKEQNIEKEKHEYELNNNKINALWKLNNSVIDGESLSEKLAYESVEINKCKQVAMWIRNFTNESSRLLLGITSILMLMITGDNAAFICFNRCIRTTIQIIKFRNGYLATGDLFDEIMEPVMKLSHCATGSAPMARPLVIKKFKFQIPNTNFVLKMNKDLILENGNNYRVDGYNKSGKSTFYNYIGGISPAQCEIDYETVYTLFQNLTIATENISYYNLLGEYTEELVKLLKMSVPDVLVKIGEKINGGQLMRIKIAVALKEIMEVIKSGRKIKIIILDEISNHMDNEFPKLFVEIINYLRKYLKDVVILFTDHHHGDEISKLIRVSKTLKCVGGEIFV